MTASPSRRGAARLGLERAAIATCVLALCCAAGKDSASAQPDLPSVAEKLLSHLGGAALNGQQLLFSELNPLPATPQRNSQLADLMELARRQDVIVPPTHALYSADMITAGLWQSDFFIANYGTALLLTEPYHGERIPVVLVHGINGSPRDFSGMVQHFAGSPYQPVCFFYPTGMGLRVAAQQLEARLQEFLVRHPASRFAVVGHSMGGLVAKGMLDERARAEALPNGRVFISIASPWRGIEAARYANRLPKGHPASWDDLASNSTFLTQLQQTPFGDQVGFYLFFAARSSNLLLTPLGNNDGVLTLDSVLGSTVSHHARDVFGFYEDHTSILSAPLVYERLASVLDSELEPARAAGQYGALPR